MEREPDWTSKMTEGEHVHAERKCGTVGVRMKDDDTGESRQQKVRVRKPGKQEPPA
jgi:hypothetical protein